MESRISILSGHVKPHDWADKRNSGDYRGVIGAIRKMRSARFEKTSHRVGACAPRLHPPSAMLKNVSMKMRELDILAFVQAVVDTGCDICAVGHRGYTIGDVDLPRDRREAVALKLREIDEKFGDRDHLLPEIVAHLRFLGRYIEISVH